MSIRAGAATRDITPDDEVRLIGHTGCERTSNGVRDPLLVSAVHLRGGSGGILALSLDLFGIDAQLASNIRRKVSVATGTKEQNIFISCTKTHSGPAAYRALQFFGDPSYSYPDQDYIALIEEQSVQAASSAAVSSRPASVATVSLDHSGTGVALVQDSGNSRIMAAIIVNKDISDYLGKTNLKISSDFVHDMRKKLSSRLGGEPVFVYYHAPSADVSPLINQSESSTDTNTGDEAATTAGDALADLIISKIKTLKKSDFSSDVQFSGKLSEIEDSLRKPFPKVHDATVMLDRALKEQSNLQKDYIDPVENNTVYLNAIESKTTMSIVLADQMGALTGVLKGIKTIPVQVLKIGDIKIIGLPVQIMPECGERIVKALGENVWIVECVNGDMQGSVLAYQGCYQLRSALFETKTGNVIIEEAMLLASD